MDWHFHVFVYYDNIGYAFDADGGYAIYMHLFQSTIG